MQNHFSFVLPIQYRNKFLAHNEKENWQESDCKVTSSLTIGSYQCPNARFNAGNKFVAYLISG